MNELKQNNKNSIKNTANDRVLSIILIPILINIEIHPNNIGYKTERVEDDDAEDGYYFKQVEYVLDKPNLLVNAKIECNNEFIANDAYVSESGTLWVAINKTTIINQSNIMKEFIFPKELVRAGALFNAGTTNPT